MKVYMDQFESLKLKNQLCFPLYAASREITRKYTPLLKELNLTYTQYLVMLVMWEHESLTVGELGHLLFLDTGTLSPLLKAMEEKGLITRKRQKGDERVVQVELSAAGDELREKALSIPQKMGQCMNLTPDEAKALYSILYKILG